VGKHTKTPIITKIGYFRTMENILVTGAGAPGGAGIILALNQNYNVHGADLDPKATGAPLCKLFHAIPAATDSTFIEALLNICNTHNIKVVVPLVTKELPIFAAHLQQFAAIGCTVVVNPPQVLNLCNDKHKLLLQMKEMGLAIPKFTAVNTFPQLLDAVTNHGYPQKVVCIKPAHSNGMRGFRIFDSSISKQDIFWAHKPNNVYMDPKDLEQTLINQFPTILVMEYLPGHEYTIDCIAHHGKAELILPRIRTRMNNGISTRGQFVNDSAVISYCQHIIEKLNLHGPIGIQLRNDDNGQPKMLEINPRLQGTTVAAAGMGINIPQLIVEQALGQQPQLNAKQLPWGKQFGRYYTEVFWDN
jgi:carbamoyl-phosphate synthase large subunit